MNDHPNNRSDDDFDEEIISSMLRSGAAFPITPEQVREAKKRIAQIGHTLPKHFADASKVCRELLTGESKAVDNVVQMPLNEFAEAKEELMRAARNGKEVLSASVEGRMRANRAKARSSNA